MGTLGIEVVVGINCWELKSHLLKALVLLTFTYGSEIWGGDLKIFTLRFSRIINPSTTKL